MSPVRGAVKIVSTYRCVWCEREEEMATQEERAPGVFVCHHGPPEGWRDRSYNHVSLLCSSDCEAEHAYAVDQACAVAYAKVPKDIRREGSNYLEPYYSQAYEAERRKAMQARKTHFL